MKLPRSPQALLMAICCLVLAVSVGSGLAFYIGGGAGAWLGGFVFAAIAVPAGLMALAAVKPDDGRPVAMRLLWGVVLVAIAVIAMLFSYNFWGQVLDGGNSSPQQRQALGAARQADSSQSLAALRRVQNEMGKLVKVATDASEAETTAGSSCAGEPSSTGQGPVSQLLRERAETYANVASYISEAARQYRAAVRRPVDPAQKHEGFDTADEDLVLRGRFSGEREMLAVDKRRFRGTESFFDPTGRTAFRCVNRTLERAVADAENAIRALDSISAPPPNRPTAGDASDQRLMRLAGKLGLVQSRAAEPFTLNEILALLISLLVMLFILLLSLGRPPARPATKPALSPMLAPPPETLALADRSEEA